MFLKDEVMTLVDLICVEKSSFFGALSTTLTFDGKNKVWEDIAGKLSEQHGQMRTKDEVSKNGIISSVSINLASLTNLHQQRGLEEVQQMLSLTNSS